MSTRSVKNGVMELAASIITDRIEFNTCVLEQFENKDHKSVHDLATIQKLTNTIEEMKQALKCIEDYQGCWC